MMVDEHVRYLFVFQSVRLNLLNSSTSTRPTNLAQWGKNEMSTPSILIRPFILSILWMAWLGVPSLIWGLTLLSQKNTLTHSHSFTLFLVETKQQITHSLSLTRSPLHKTTIFLSKRCCTIWPNKKEKSYYCSSLLRCK